MVSLQCFGEPYFPENLDIMETKAVTSQVTLHPTHFQKHKVDFISPSSVFMDPIIYPVHTNPS